MKNLFFLTILLIFLSLNLTYSQWEECNHGIKVNQINSITSSNNIIYAGTQNGSFYFSNDDGNSWNSINLGLSDLNINKIVINGNNLILGTNKGILLSSDDGKTWKLKNSGIKYLNITDILVLKNIIYAVGVNIYVSSDTCDNWNILDNGIEEAPIYSIANNGNDLFAGSRDFGIVFSSNNGKNWTPKNDGILTPEMFSKIVILDSVIITGNEGTLDISYNYGTNWNGVFLNEKKYFGPTCFLIYNQNIFVGTLNGLFLSRDKGTSWLEQNIGPNNLNISTLEIKDNVLFAGTTVSGIFRAKLSDFGLTDVSESQLISSNENISIFPNPIKDNKLKIQMNNQSNTNISYEIVSPTGLSISKGEIVADLKQKEININNLASGIYILKLQYDGQIESKQFIVVR